MKKGQKTVASKVLTCVDSTFKTAKGWSMEMSSLIDMEIPAYLGLQEQNAFITWAGWFTEGHIEFGGDESVAHVPNGKRTLVFETWD